MEGYNPVLYDAASVVSHAVYVPRDDADLRCLAPADTITPAVQPSQPA